MHVLKYITELQNQQQSNIIHPSTHTSHDQCIASIAAQPQSTNHEMNPTTHRETPTINIQRIATYIHNIKPEKHNIT